MPLLEAGAESAATTALPASMVSSFLCGVCVTVCVGLFGRMEDEAEVPAKSFE